MRTSTCLIGSIAAVMLPPLLWSQDPQVDTTSAPGNQPATEKLPIDTPDLTQPADRRAESDAKGKSEIDGIVSAWPERPRLAAKQMVAKYGQPHVITPDKLVWREQGSFKRITVTKEEHAHDFPKPHMDFLEHTIVYRVPADKADELTRFDSSLTFNRTKGELSARCDIEGHNILALNIAHDIVAGRLDFEEARQTFAQLVVQDSLGKKPIYVTALQFEPASEPTGYADKPIIPGVTKRMPQNEEDQPAGRERQMGDAEVLGSLIALDENEILAAMVASEKKLTPQVEAYVKMLHTQHGENLEKSMKLGQKLDLAPIETPQVDQLRRKAAGELAGIVEFDGKEFSEAFLGAMIKGHSASIAMIDNELQKNAEDQTLKEHLIASREHMAAHLEEARRIQPGLQHEAAGTVATPATPPQPPVAETRPTDAPASSRNAEPGRKAEEPAVRPPAD